MPTQKNRHLCTIAQICRAISSPLRYISTIEKTLLSSNISPTCPHNMVNFGPLAAEIISLVWRTQPNFNGFRVLAALLHGSRALGASQTAALSTGRHLYLAGLPSRWALAHILVILLFLSIHPWHHLSLLHSQNLPASQSFQRINSLPPLGLTP